MERGLRQGLEGDVVTQTHATVTRYWPTGVVIDHVDLVGIVNDRLISDLRVDGASFERLPPCALIADQVALTAEFLASMNALAQGQGTAPVEAVELGLEVWRAGYDLPATAYAAEFVGWCFLASSPTPTHSESGAIAIADPRAGSALTAMPGLPWGRQMMIRPVPGAHLAVPGWLTCSVVPVETCQYAVVAVAQSIR